MADKTARTWLYMLRFPVHLSSITFIITCFLFQRGVGWGKTWHEVEVLRCFFGWCLDPDLAGGSTGYLTMLRGVLDISQVGDNGMVGWLHLHRLSRIVHNVYTRRTGCILFGNALLPGGRLGSVYMTERGI